MRIVAGEHGGRRLRAPRGSAVRPTGDRAREALFARLGPLDDVRVLDLFAGSGALGLEALSRGARDCVFCDVSPESLAVVRANVEALGLGARSELRRGDFRRVLRDLARGGRRFGLALVDPPYTLLPRAQPALAELLPAVLEPAATVVVEAPATLDLSLPFSSRSVRRYGAAAIHILTA
jgi:16S rRNA (guanine966-N2)-methyltransferase